MSESVIHSREISAGAAFDATGLVDLNDVVSTVLASLTNRVQELQAIVRKDAIAMARGNEKDFETLFSNVLEIILEHPPQEGKLFIYIRSVQNDPAADDKFVTVSIHTNTTYDPAWEKSCADRLSECGNICNTSGGGFVYHLVSNTSCLFTINLQGK